MYVIKNKVVLPVDYDNPKNRTIDPKDYRNRNPHVASSHFPIDETGTKAVHFGLLIPDADFDAEQALVMIKDVACCSRPNLADTLVYDRDCPEELKVPGYASYCGTLHDQGGYLFIAYMQSSKKGPQLFFNWMKFMRDAGTPLLIVLNE